MYLSVSELLRELRENSGIKNSPINTGKSRKLDTFWKLLQVSSKVILVWNISRAFTSVYLSGHHCSNGDITTALMSVYPRRTDCLNWNIPITPTSVYPRGHDCLYGNTPTAPTSFHLNGHDCLIWSMSTIPTSVYWMILIVWLEIYCIFAYFYLPVWSRLF